MDDDNKVKQMDTLRAEIAGRNGWKVTRDKQNWWQWNLSNNKGFVSARFVRNKKVKLTLRDFIAWLPGYPYDLNAIQQAINDMPKHLRDVYNLNLAEETAVYYDYSEVESLDNLVNASAETRSKVYLKTMTESEEAGRRHRNELRTISRRRSNTTKHKARSRSSV